MFALNVMVKSLLYMYVFILLVDTYYPANTAVFPAVVFNADVFPAEKRTPEIRLRSQSYTYLPLGSTWCNSPFPNYDLLYD